MDRLPPTLPARPGADALLMIKIGSPRAGQCGGVSSLNYRPATVEPHPTALNERLVIARSKGATAATVRLAAGTAMPSLPSDWSAPGGLSPSSRTRFRARCARPLLRGTAALVATPGARRSRSAAGEAEELRAREGGGSTAGGESKGAILGMEPRVGGRSASAGVLRGAEGGRLPSSEGGTADLPRLWLCKLSR